MRSRAYKKNDQAWVEQKNGAVVQCLVGDGGSSDADAAAALRVLYATSRLYINFSSLLQTEGQSARWRSRA